MARSNRRAAIRAFNLSHWILVAVAPLFLLACATKNSVRDAPREYGADRYFRASYTQTVEAVAATLPAIGLKNTQRQSDDPRITVFLGTGDISGAGWGEIVRVTVTDVDGARVLVNVYWRHRLRDGIVTSAPNWTEDVFAGVSQRLP